MKTTTAEFKESFASVQKKLHETKALIDAIYEIDNDDGSVDFVQLSNSLDSLTYQYEWLSARIDNLWQTYIQHLDGHLPKILGADKMQNALKVLGIGDDYEVKPQVIYASDGQPSSILATISRGKIV